MRGNIMRFHRLADPSCRVATPALVACRTGRRVDRIERLRAVQRRVFPRHHPVRRAEITSRIGVQHRQSSGDALTNLLPGSTRWKPSSGLTNQVEEQGLARQLAGRVAAAPI
jgi:hypothetical protein